MFAPLVFNFYRFTGNIIDTQSIEIYLYETKGPKFKIFKDKVMVGRKLFDSMHRFYNIDKLSLKLYLYFLFIFFITAFLMQNGRNKFNYANRRRIYLLIYISMVRSSWNHIFTFHMCYQFENVWFYWAQSLFVFIVSQILVKWQL